MRNPTSSTTLYVCISLVTALSYLNLSANGAVLPISRTGKYLFDSTGSRFYIKGIAYQTPSTLITLTAQQVAAGDFAEPISYSDPLVDITSCTRDIPNFTALGVNTIRVYNLDPSGDHSACMNALNNANIYLIADLGLPNGSINRASPSWDITLLDQYITTINSLVQYPNLLGVTVGNEVANALANTNSLPFVKAAARDIKTYLTSINKASVLVGYAAVDVTETDIPALAEYLVCGNDPDGGEGLDWWGINSYSWCGDSNYVASGYQNLTDALAEYPIVAIFSEFGCVTAPRLFTEVAAIFSEPMTQVFSGGIAFEYFYDDNGYGITNNLTASGGTLDGPITTNSQFDLLTSKFKAAIPPAESKGSNLTQYLYAGCLSSNAPLLASNTLPPTPDATVCYCIEQNALPCYSVENITADSIGALLDYGCGAIGSAGGTCDVIAGNGQTGVYGTVSGCSAAQKIGYVSTVLQETTGQGCPFPGNITSNPLVSLPQDASALSSAVSSCLSFAAPSSVDVIPSIIPSPTRGAAIYTPTKASTTSYGVATGAGGVASGGSSTNSGGSAASSSSPSSSSATPGSSGSSGSSFSGVSIWTAAYLLMLTMLYTSCL